MDINGIVRRTLDARKVSFAPKDEVLSATQMEYGGITPVGLPAGWPILLDERVANAPRMIVGAGTTKAKLSLPGRALAELPGAEVVAGLGVEIQE
jgi:prolyl-tRNA editing enzyme YbaK/EbsC (Cys-tRNA(Pro) deacylase)